MLKCVVRVSLHVKTGYALSRTQGKKGVGQVNEKSSTKVQPQRWDHQRVHKRTENSQEHGEVRSSTVQFSSLACHLHFELQASSHEPPLPRFNQPKCGIICGEYLMSSFKRAVFLTSYLVNNSSRSVPRGPSVQTVANSTELRQCRLSKRGDKCETIHSPVTSFH